ncbi:MAG TPA: 3-methyl-2-oxobutanoate dehydrogenase subunit VorB [Bacteroidales bacterium]|jgi:2-oxoglutarate ferredoxin oxidoreductase subunit alpha|nr:3-methyl-2-oxobutanoate dehydrogenase subunit VorB [Bacteroidales bacterium]OQC58773.1 MAG: 2-oxoglutarate oxidoreductase subunit KorA [Bacteroidetes bacterium ADurb.Bin013]MBP8999077.1 3-methyl-2-oxobutanoate dehydrogenase subunit VorB [Bacteroidales bacterium]MBV6455833.1 2-oxoglutarate oxidoreductase subunit KorA [Bacteroidales bacterium]NLZ08274.1 3-methyl-2-oxobutanoate dehydrogenase subunit VorB [Bacteroidales bacterium]
MAEKLLKKGNEAIALAAIRYGADGYFGYPITPQSEVMETLMEEMPWETTGMVVLQAESETSSINMLYGGACCGKKVMTSSSSPGISLMCEGISYMAGAELPCLVVDVIRGGPGLGTIQPAQGDYFQAVKGGGHGDYKIIVLAPASVQEMYDFVGLGFDLAFKYRNPVMILSDGAIGQMMEKVELRDPVRRLTDKEITEKYGHWATVGKPASRKGNIISSLSLAASEMEAINLRLQAKYQKMRENEVRFEKTMCDNAEYLLVAFGSSARICEGTLEIARSKGIRMGLLRPITLFPYPETAIREMLPQLKGIMSVELNAGQMVEDVRLAVNGAVPVEFYGRMGGSIFSPEEVFEAFAKKFNL